MKNPRVYIGMSAVALSLVMAGAAFFGPVRASAEEKEGYMLKNWCGKVAIYTSNGTEPVKTTGIELKNLPSADQKELEKGIFIQNEEELARILEDLGS